MDDLDKKILEYFPGKSVRKDLTELMKNIDKKVPTYVIEFLLGQSCASDDPDVIHAGMEKIKKILAENCVSPEKSEYIKSKIRENGIYTIIDKITVTLEESIDQYVASFTNLKINPFIIDENIVTHNEKLLIGGVWCILKIEYSRFDDAMEEEDLWGEKKKKQVKKSKFESPFKIASLKPIQMPNLNLNEMKEARKNFTKDEWISVLLRSIGYEPSAIKQKQRLHYLLRLVPFIQSNYNLMELGGRSTGKSHVYGEVSPYCYLVSGGSTSRANLFFNMSTKKIGLVGRWDCVAFDEVAKANFNDSTITTLKNYMANGKFGIGADSNGGEASLAFEGNTVKTPQQMMRFGTLFEPLPPDMRDDAALLDRVHYYLPGWETPKLRSSLFSSTYEHYGLITDCVAEYCHGMRIYDYTLLLDKYFTLDDKTINKRDEEAIRRTFSGLAKLIYPNQDMSKEETEELLRYAIEGRRRVKEQLKKLIPAEFADIDLSYIDNDTGEKKTVELPEKPGDTLIPNYSPEAGHVYAIGEGNDHIVAVYCLQNSKVNGWGKLGNIEGIGGTNYARVKISIKSAFDYFAAHCKEVLPGRQSDFDYNLYFDDLQERGASDDISVAEFIGLCSAFADKPAISSLAVVGRIVASESLMPLSAELSDIVAIAMGAGGTNLLLPDKSKDQFERLPLHLKEGVHPIFYTDPIDAVKKALGLEE